MLQADDLKKDAAKMVEEFNTTAPFSADFSPEQALSMIADMRAKVAAMKAQEAEIRKGLGMFKIDQPPNRELQMLERASSNL